MNLSGGWSAEVKIHGDDSVSFTLKDARGDEWTVGMLGSAFRLSRPRGKKPHSETWIRQQIENKKAEIVNGPTYVKRVL